MTEASNERKIAAEWIRIIEDPSAQQTREKDIYPRLKNWIDSVSPSQILEIGAGQGVCSSVLDLENRTYTGIEPSKTLLLRAQQLSKDPRTRFVLGRAESMPLANSAFDAVFSIAVWHLIEDINTAARELYRVLRTRGSFMIILANPEASSLWTEPYANTKMDGPKFSGEIKLNDGSVVSETLYFHSRAALIASLQTAGLIIVRTDLFREVGQNFKLMQIEGQKLS